MKVSVLEEGFGVVSVLWVWGSNCVRTASFKEFVLFQDQVDYQRAAESGSDRETGCPDDGICYQEPEDPGARYFFPNRAIPIRTSPTNPGITPIAVVIGATEISSGRSSALPGS